MLKLLKILLIAFWLLYFGILVKGVHFIIVTKELNILHLISLSILILLGVIIFIYTFPSIIFMNTNVN